MAETKIRVNVDSRGAEQGLQKVNSSLRQTEKQSSTANREVGGLQRGMGGLQKVAIAAGGAIATYFSVQTISRFAKQAVSDFADVEVSMWRIGRQAEMMGKAWASQDYILEFSREIGDATLGSAEEVRQATQLLLTQQDLTKESYEETIKTAQSLSEVTGVNMPTAARYFVRAMTDASGAMSMFQRYGISLTEQQQEQIKALSEAGETGVAYAQMLEYITEVLPDASEGGTTLAHSFDSAGESSKILREELGELLAPTVDRLTKKFTELSRTTIQWLRSFRQAQEEHVDKLRENLAVEQETLRNMEEMARRGLSGLYDSESLNHQRQVVGMLQFEIELQERLIKNKEITQKKEEEKAKATEKAVREAAKAAKAEAEALQTITQATEKLEKAREKARQQEEQAARQRLESAQGAFEALKREIDPVYNSMAMLNDQLDVLDEMLALDEIDIDEWASWDGKIREARESMRDVASEVGVLGREISEAERIWDQMLRNIQSANANTIREMLDGNLRSWRDYGDMIVDIMKDTFAQIAAAALQQQVVLPIIAQMGGAMGQQAVMGMGGQAVAGGAGGWIGAAMGTAIPGTAGVPAAGAAYATHPAYAASPTVPYGASTVGAVAAPLAGFGGGYMLGGQNTEAGVLSGMGTAMAAGLGLGPIGLLAGGLAGGGLSRLVGREKTSRIGITSGADEVLQRTSMDEEAVAWKELSETMAESMFGAIGAYTRKMDASDFTPLFSWMASLDDVLYNALDDSMQQAAEGFQHRTGNIQEDKLTWAIVDRYNALFEQIDEGVEWQAGAMARTLAMFSEQARDIEDLDEFAVTMETNVSRVVGVFNSLSDAGERIERYINEGLTHLEAFDRLEEEVKKVSGILGPAIQRGLEAAVYTLDFSDFKKGLQEGLQDQMRQAVYAAAQQSFVSGIMQGAFDQALGLDELMMSYFAGDVGLEDLEGGLSNVLDQVDSMVPLWEKFTDVMRGLGLVAEDEAAIREQEQTLRERQSLEMQLLRLQGDTAAIRERELAGIDESNRALQERIWALQDEAEAERKATEALQQNLQSVQNAYSTFTNTISDQRQAVDDAFGDYARAVEDEISQKHRQAEEYRRTADDMARLSDSLSDFQQSIVVGSNSPLGVGAQRAAALAEFRDVATAAQSGNMDAAGNLQSVAQDLLSTSARAGFISEDTKIVQAALNAVQNEIGQQESDAARQARLLERQADKQQEQLDALRGFEEQTLEQLKTAWETEKEQLSWMETQNDTFQNMLKYEAIQYEELQNLVAGTQDVESAIDNVYQAINSLDTYSGSPDTESSYSPSISTRASDRRRGIDSAWSWPETVSLSGGGTVSGPSSGYTIPTTFHDVEHITPDSHMVGVKKELAEIKVIMTQIRDTGGDMNGTSKKLYRILDGVTQGGTTIRTTAVT